MSTLRSTRMMCFVGSLIAVLTGFVGCGESPKSDVSKSSSSPTQQASADAAPKAKAKTVVAPDKIVTTFLEAVRTGDEQGAAAMLTPLAIKRTAEYELTVAPTGSATAQYSVGEVEYIEGGGAHVASTWSDLDAGGERRTDTLVWMLRQEPSGWRIAGLGTIVFPDQPPIFLNFENPEDMLEKQRLTEEEFNRRTTGETATTGTAAVGQQPQGSIASGAAANVASQTPQQPNQLSQQQYSSQPSQRQAQAPVGENTGARR
ncbi:MAG: hypothetical protein KDA63_18835 [Planctomycetales bacterium]|nr:hypothetical protein [Planctomycetales bacterium]